MPKKIIVDKSAEEIKKVLKEKKFVIGTDLGLKSLKLGKAEKVFLASNCSDETKKETEKLARLSKAEIVVVEQPNDELGTMCKKPFAISMLTVLKK